MIEVEKRQLNRILRHSRETYPYECCGILIGRVGGRKRVEDLLETRNAAPRQGRDRYRIDGRDFLRADKIARKRGLDILGFYHSHPACTGVPSSRDRTLAWNDYSYLIVSLPVGEAPTFTCWVLDPAGTSFIEEKIEAS